MPEPTRDPSVAARTRRAREAAAALARSSRAARDAGLQAFEAALDEDRATILAANAADVAAASSEVAAGRMTRALLDRLKLDERKLDDLKRGLTALRAMPDPLGRVTLATELDDGLALRRVTCPIGVVAVIFESRPEALAQIAGLALKSGNALLAKGGSEAARSNRALADALEGALAACGLPDGTLSLLTDRAEVAELLGADRDVDLIVPRGGNALVRSIQRSTSIPVLGHADGLCHVTVDRAADLDMAVAIAVDAKVQYAAACNAAETLLVHRDVAARFVPAVTEALRERGVEVRGDDRARACAERGAGGGMAIATDADWDTEYSDLVIAIRVVDDLDEALQHIRRHGSRHTETLVTEDDAAWQRFAAEVDAAGVFRNASTRFADGFRYGFGAEVGISTGKLHPRGPVGLDGLVTYKYLLEGNGHRVADYATRPFTHRPIG
jgi:glutamate-5-semialdehyde dehydrogenase